MNNKIKGNSGEDIVCAYLKKNGYEIIERNFRTQIGEIDIVAADDGCLVFVEVKTRFSFEYGHPSEAVNIKKQHTISRVAAQFIQKYSYFDTAIRFDVAEVVGKNFEVNLIKNAFDSQIRY